MINRWMYCAYNCQSFKRDSNGEIIYYFATCEDKFSSEIVFQDSDLFIYFSGNINTCRMNVLNVDE